MDLETFYESNEARRESAEFEYGDDWTDAVGNHYELSWVEATGELYIMIEPDAHITEDAFGDWYPQSEDVSELTVVVVGQVVSHDHLESLLDGWEDAIDHKNSLTWLYQRFPVVK
ncbi:MAG TPA: hypothetical protein VIJ86_02135 [Acidimicrobiales bacterium]